MCETEKINIYVNKSHIYNLMLGNESSTHTLLYDFIINMFIINCHPYNIVMVPWNVLVKCFQELHKHVTSMNICTIKYIILY